MRQIRLRIDDENYARLLKAKEQKYSSINALINSALLEYFNKESDEKLLKENTSTLERYKLPYKLINQDFLITPLRQIKEVSEIENIKKAVNITLNSIKELENILRPGLTELQIKNFLENEFKKQAYFRGLQKTKR